MMLWSSPLKCCRGLTLTEVMVVVAIIGALTTIAIPNFLDWNRKAKLRDAVGLLQGNMNIARMNAINLNSPVTVTVAQASSASPVTVTFINDAGSRVIQDVNLDAEV